MEEREESYEAAAWIQVSIGSEQSRLVSPRTPAVEKAQALQEGDGFFGDFSIPEDDQLPSHDGTSEPPTRSNDTRSTLRDAFTRRRASSGPERALENIQKAILSIPKKFSLSTEPNLVQQQSDERPQLPKTESDDTATDLPGRPQLERLKTSHSLRRSFSDESLALSRAFSQASSLGDDSRFEHIQNQVNSRMKAIRDSWQDAKLPSFSALKPDLPALSSLRPDFLKTHAHSRSIDATMKPADPLTRQPFSSYEALHEDLKRSGHTFLDHAMATLEGNVIILGGYRGSILRSAKPPHKQLWVPIKVGLNLRKVDLEVGIAPEDDDKPADNVVPDRMLKHIGPVDISARLFRRLRACPQAQAGKLRVHDYGYDWRLDPLFLSKQLLDFVASLPGKPIVIAHSLGGLVTRHAVNQRPDLFRGVVYAGVPTRCVNILGPLRNGDDVLLSSRVLTAQVNFTIRTSFALLPLDGRCFIDKHTREEYPVDFFSAETWREYRLSPCISRPLPSLRGEPQGIASYVSKVLPLRKSSTARPRPDVAAGGVAEPDASAMSSSTTLVDPEPDQVSTHVTMQPDQAFEYLTRMLARVKRFKQELAYKPEQAHAYPPIAAIYGKNTPTVIGARVDGRDGIRRADAYDDLTFGSGDGVVLARAAMPPRGYQVSRGGIISSERGHVSLLGDLDAVGKALLAISRK